MRFSLKISWILIVFSIVTLSFAGTIGTHRTPQIKNSRVTVWETTIYPGTLKKLSMHRHDQDRVVVALTDGVLKVQTDKGEISLLKLTKNQSYFLPAEKAGVLHTDENLGKDPIKVIVISLN